MKQEMTVIEFAQRRLTEAERQYRHGAGDGNDIQYLAAYLDGAKAQLKESNKNPHGPMREKMIDQQIEIDELRERVANATKDVERLIEALKLTRAKIVSLEEWVKENERGI